jgi:hypothetical protein
VVIAIEKGEISDQDFTVVRLVEEPLDYFNLGCQWYQADKEFGTYKPCLDSKQKPWLTYQPATVICTRPFELQADGTLPDWVVQQVKWALPEIRKVASGDDPEPAKHLYP